ncbi:MAG: hypothetical protein K9H61_00815 [Bacteroidia bacterium]|nr:hypothetical protein [Bacteroidia bacterium]MCF8445507.1 hypothetical protein [Bacteroidia bacterium]
MKNLKVFAVLVWLFLCPLAQTSVYSQCAMCKSNVETAREGGGTMVGNTLNNGIMYLLVLPYAIAGVFAFIYYKKYKEKQAANTNSTTQS